MTIKTGVAWKSNNKKGTLTLVDSANDLTNWQVKSNTGAFEVKKTGAGNHFFTVEIKRTKIVTERLWQTEEIDITITNDNSSQELTVSGIPTVEDPTLFASKSAAFKSSIVLNTKKEAGQGRNVFSFVRLEIDTNVTDFRFARKFNKNRVEFQGGKHTWECKPIRGDDTSTQLIVRVHCTGQSDKGTDDTEEIDVTITNEDLLISESAPLVVDYIDEMPAGQD